MAKVILCTGQEGPGPLERPILKREDVELERFEDGARAFIKLKASPFDLFIWEQTLEKTEALVFFNHIQKAFGETRLKVICAWKEPAPEDLPPIVAKSFTYPPDEAEYDKFLSEFLKTEVRKTRRVLIRVRLAVQRTGQGLLCSTINVSKDGLLIESNKPLQVKHIYMVTFLGLKGVNLPPFKTRIVRKDAPPRGNFSLNYYGGIFEDVPRSQTDALAEALNL